MKICALFVLACACSSAPEPTPAPRQAMSDEERAWLRAEPTPLHAEPTRLSAEPKPRATPPLAAENMAFAERFYRSVREHFAVPGRASDVAGKSVAVVATMKPSGELIDVVVSRSSGAAALDAAAVAAVRGAAPFRDPPPNVVADGVEIVFTP